MVTGVDLVQWQIRIARGEKLTLDPAALLTPRGHAIECRIIAEDPDAGFMPSPGHISQLRVPSGPGIRDDGGTESGATVPIFYDPMISKLVAWGENRAQAIARMKRALSEYEVVGIKTSIPFFQWMLNQPDFENAAFDTTYLDALLKARQGESFARPGDSDEELAAIAAALHTALKGSAAMAVTTPANGDGATAGMPHANRWRSHARVEGLRTS
jgi:acetyl-CoA carboxylase biotin carboxylase subunit